jgi:very-short-patch-repair endonuclease
MTQIAPHTRANAKRLRAETTPHERRVWSALRDMNRIFGSHFRRQAPIGPFIADFADYGRRLVIEIDGGQHGGAVDAARDGFLVAQGFRVMRFWNSDVTGNLDGVLQVVMEAVGVGVGGVDDD